VSPTDLYWSPYLTAPPKVGRFMDIGCGNGGGYRAIGLEPTPEADHACHNVGHSVIISRADLGGRVPSWRHS